MFDQAKQGCSLLHTLVQTCPLACIATHHTTWTASLTTLLHQPDCQRPAADALSALLQRCVHLDSIRQTHTTPICQ